MNMYFEDEMKCILKQAKIKNLGSSNYANNEINIICDNINFAAYLVGFFAEIKNKDNSFKTNINVLCTNESKQNKTLAQVQAKFEKVKIYVAENFEEFFTKKQKSMENFFVFAPELNLKKYKDEKHQQQLKFMLEKSLELSGKLIFCPSFNFEKPIENSIYCVAEKEIEAIAVSGEEFKQARFLIELEKICGEQFKKSNKFISVVRFDNVFGPCLNSSSKLDFSALINSVKSEVVLNKSDLFTKYSALYVRDAVLAILTVSKFGKRGNIYNASGYDFSINELKSILLEKFASENPKVSYNDDVQVSKVSYERLSSNKLEQLTFATTIDFREAIYKTACEQLGLEYYAEFYNEVYQGKLERVKELEMKLLMKFDEICKKNNITYFLAGGTMLGSVRHKGFIPWDDDIDVGMLREDYEKFRKICGENLNDDTFFQCYKQDENSHYIFDKIRLKDTFFNTVSSDNFCKMENGIFIDVLVYDKTSNNKLLQEYHIFQIRVLKLILNMLWLDQSKKQMRKKLAKFAVPVLKLLPFKFYHWCFDKVLCKYRNSKNSEFLLDGVGLNLTKGAMPIQWLSEYKDNEFEGETFKVSAHCEDYLKYLYGENYMQLLPYSSRFSGHKIVRLDLGKYLFDNCGDKDIEPNKLEGELF